MENFTEYFTQEMEKAVGIKEITFNDNHVKIHKTDGTFKVYEVSDVYKPITTEEE